MRKIILFNMVSLDGYFAGKEHVIDWHNVDTDFNEFAIKQLKAIDTIIMGRKTYELMAKYWQSPEALIKDQKIALLMNSKKKIVFSKTMSIADWNNTIVINENIPSEVKTQKRLPGKDIIILGSADLTSTFRKHALIDEYRLMVNPIILGQGCPLLKEPSEQLILAETKTFKSGNILLVYRPK